MRIIKFRGKCVGDIGSWAYGYYHYDSVLNQHYICLETSLVRKEVIPETIGQYTGINSTVSGTEIYEGDLVQCWNGRLDMAKGAIEFSDGSFFIKNFKAQYSEWSNAENIIITGNIHD